MDKLKDLEKKYEELGKEIEKLKSKDEPKVGDFCKFWDMDEDKKIYGYLDEIINNGNTLPYVISGHVYMNCEKAHFSPDTIDVRDVYKHPEKYEDNFLGRWTDVR